MFGPFPGFRHRIEGRKAHGKPDRSAGTLMPRKVPGSVALDAMSAQRELGDDSSLRARQIGASAEIGGRPALRAQFGERNAIRLLALLSESDEP